MVGGAFNYLRIFAFRGELKHNSYEKRGSALNKYKFWSENMKVRQPFEYVAGKYKIMSSWFLTK